MVEVADECELGNTSGQIFESSDYAIPDSYGFSCLRTVKGLHTKYDAMHTT